MKGRTTIERCLASSGADAFEVTGSQGRPSHPVWERGSHSSGSPSFRRPSIKGGMFGMFTICHLTVSGVCRRWASTKAGFA